MGFSVYVVIMSRTSFRVNLVVGSNLVAIT